MLVSAPILVADDKSAQEAFKAFNAKLYVDPAETTRSEAQRLGPYFNALAKVLREGGVPLKQGVGARAWLDALADPAALQELFLRMGQVQKITILSDLAIVPTTLPKSLSGSYRDFSSRRMYEGEPAAFGFLSRREKEWGMEIPYMALSSKMLAYIAPHEPQEMLKAYQRIMNVGNHDMLHHFSSDALNPEVWRKEGVREIRGHIAGHWRRDFFGADDNPLSYESFLMLLQKQVWGRMEPSAAAALQTDVTMFCGELKRISTAMRPSSAHAKLVRDYFATAAIQALVRFLPGDDPIIGGAVKNLQAMGAPVAERAVRLTPWVNDLMKKAAPGSDLAKAQDRCVSLAVGMILSAAQDVQFYPGVGTRVVSIGPSQYNFRDGVCVSDGGNPAITEEEGGGVRQIWRNDKGQVHRADGGPAITRNSGNMQAEWWYVDGKPENPFGGPIRAQWHEDWAYVLEWTHKSRVVFPDGGYKVFYDPSFECPVDEPTELMREVGQPSDPFDLRITQKWKNKKGQLHREYALPALIVAEHKADKETGEDRAVYRFEWYRNGELWRQDGPAVVTIHADMRVEDTYFFENGRCVSKSKRHPGRAF